MGIEESFLDSLNSSNEATPEEITDILNKNDFWEVCEKNNINPNSASYTPKEFFSLLNRIRVAEW